MNFEVTWQGQRSHDRDKGHTSRPFTHRLLKYLFCEIRQHEWFEKCLVYRYCTLATKCYFFAILFALCDNTNCGLLKFSTDFWPCLLWPWILTYIVHFATKCYSFAFSNLILFPFAVGDSTSWGLQNLDTEFWHLTPLNFDPDFYFYCPPTLATKCHLFTISKTISIPFALWDSTSWGLQKFYKGYWPLTLIFYLYCTFWYKMLLRNSYF